MTGPQIRIGNEQIYRSTLSTLETLKTELTEKMKAADAVVAAVTAAASKDVAHPSSGAVAAAYTETVKALETATGNINRQAEAAATAVGTAITELTNLINGLMAIDQKGADGVNSAG